MENQYPLMNAAGRSRSSQSQSPSHSAASVSATSSHRKRKLPPSSTATFSADTPNDDLESISARGGGGDDSDSDEDSDVAVDDEEEEFDDSSMRNFTSARLENPAPASAPAGRTKVKLESSVKVETPDLAKDGGGVAGTAGTGAAVTAAGGAVAGGVGKEEVKTIFTDNIQTSGAYIAREENLKREEEAGRLRFLCVSNDGTDQHMVWLVGLKNIFSRQLPNMPKEYIVRLVMDRNHKSVVVIRKNLVVGGITYRPYLSQRFGEIAFCAIAADEQVKGYGTRLMNHLKQHARDDDALTHFLTYADNNAVGYFVKQGFTKEISLDKDRWHGYIKDYDGGILMQCKIDSKLPFTDLSTMLRRQRLAIDEKIRELSNCHTVYTGVDFQKKEAGVPKKIAKIEDVPGLREAGYTPDQYGHSRFKILVNGDGTSNQKSLTAFLRSLLKAMLDHPDVWPFKEPVDARDVPDYYHIIKDPMDLKTMSKRVDSEQYYVTLEMFIADAKRMFANARTYNAPETIYYKCATRLESHFSSKVQLGLQSLTKLPP